MLWSTTSLPHEIVDIGMLKYTLGTIPFCEVVVRVVDDENCKFFFISSKETNCVDMSVSIFVTRIKLMNDGIQIYSFFCSPWPKLCSIGFGGAYKKDWRPCKLRNFRMCWIVHWCLSSLVVFETYLTSTYLLDMDAKWLGIALESWGGGWSICFDEEGGVNWVDEAEWLQITQVAS